MKVVICVRARVLVEMPDTNLVVDTVTLRFSFEHGHSQEMSSTIGEEIRWKI